MQNIQIENWAQNEHRSISNHMLHILLLSSMTTNYYKLRGYHETALFVKAPLDVTTTLSL